MQSFELDRCDRLLAIRSCLAKTTVFKTVNTWRAEVGEEKPILNESGLTDYYDDQIIW